MRIGVLALQGSFREHEMMLKKLGIDPVLVKSKIDCESLDGLILPGGESTTISDLMTLYGIDKEIITLHQKRIPLYGTCAGAIMLSTNPGSPKVQSLGLIDITTNRNGYGTQKDSFETELDIKWIGTFKGIFIRAPIITSFSEDINVLSEFNSTPVLLKKENILISTFHPELTDDTRIHEFFLQMVKNRLCPQSQGAASSRASYQSNHHGQEGWLRRRMSVITNYYRKREAAPCERMRD